MSRLFAVSNGDVCQTVGTHGTVERMRDPRGGPPPPPPPPPPVGAFSRAELVGVPLLL